MKILLIKPPLNTNLITAQLYEPLELEYLASSVKDHQVRILDMRIDHDLTGELKRFRPGLVGITAYTCDFNTVKNILREIKNFDSTIRTVVGGHHATFLPFDFALHSVDAVFIGYSDHSFPQYVKAFDHPEKIKEIPNIGIVENGHITFTKKEVLSTDLNDLPLPDRSLTKKYRDKYHDSVRNKMTLVMTSRGCPFRCNFCACWKLMNGKYTSRTPESIVHELKNLPPEIDVVYFSDDNTFNNIKRMWKLSRLIKENNINKKFQMYARADTIVRNPELFKDLKQAGLQFITIGLESFQNKDLDFYKKKTSIQMNNKAIQILRDAGIYILAHLMVRPEYTAEDFRLLQDYVIENNLFRPAFPVLTPLPGTELYEDNLSSFVLTNYDYFDFAHSILPTKLNHKEFYQELANLYEKSYSIKRYVNYRIRQFFSGNSNNHTTNNTDGINLAKLIAVYYFSKPMVRKIRNSYLAIEALR